MAQCGAILYPLRNWRASSLLGLAAFLLWDALLMILLGMALFKLGLLLGGVSARGGP